METMNKTRKEGKEKGGRRKGVKGVIISIGNKISLYNLTYKEKTYLGTEELCVTSDTPNDGRE